MSEINVTFQAEDGSQAEVQVDDTMTAGQVIQNLLEEQFIPPPKPDTFYALVVKGQGVIQDNQTLASFGLKSGSLIQILSNGIGGFEFLKKEKK
jgi:uncharacterized ubiquitin-like protein YukD